MPCQVRLSSFGAGWTVGDTDCCACATPVTASRAAAKPPKSAAERQRSARPSRGFLVEAKVKLKLYTSVTPWLVVIVAKGQQVPPIDSGRRDAVSFMQHHTYRDRAALVARQKLTVRYR